MKNCLMCGEPFSGKRSDSLYCSNSCKAKYFDLKKKDQLPKNGLSGLTLSEHLKQKTQKQSTENQSRQRTVDMDDLIPFDNLVDTWDDFDNENKSTDFPKNENQAINNPFVDTKKSFPHNPSKELPYPFIAKQISKSNPFYTTYQQKLATYQSDIKKCDAEIKRLSELLQKAESDNGNGYLVSGIVGGSVLAGVLQNPIDKSIPTGDQTKSSYKRKLNQLKKLNAENKQKNIFSAVLSIVAGTGIGYFFKENYKKNNEKQKQQAIFQINKAITECHQIKTTLTKQKEELISKNAFVTKLLIENVDVPNPYYEKALKEINTRQNQPNPLSGLNNMETNKVENNKDTEHFFDSINKNPFDNISIPLVEKSNPLETDKISSMKNIAKLKFKLLNFKDKWLHFFGLPQTNFFCVIHGMSGEGKTNFSIQFAKYLAENFGNVLYVSGEEGFAPTFQQKIKALGADRIPRLYAADIRTGEELLNEIPNKYHFIVIDSINNMDIDPELMKAIRNKFKQSGIIAICQSTKDGKIRGSYQIVHDSDMAVQVVNGIARTTKNRFKEKGMEFDVFAAYKKDTSKIIKLNPNNKNDKLDEDFRNTTY